MSVSMCACNKTRCNLGYMESKPNPDEMTSSTPPGVVSLTTSALEGDSLDAVTSLSEDDGWQEIWQVDEEATTTSLTNDDDSDLVDGTPGPVGGDEKRSGAQYKHTLNLEFQSRPRILLHGLIIIIVIIV